MQKKELHRYAKVWLPTGFQGESYGNLIFTPFWPKRTRKRGRPKNSNPRLRLKARKQGVGVREFLRFATL